MTKKIYIKTYGCQMNFYDSSRMEDLMAPLGYGRAENPEDADLIVLNTCHIREKAAEKMYSDLGRLRSIKQEGKDTGKEVLIAVAGCVGQAEGAEITRRAPYVDMVMGPQTYQQLPELVGKALRHERKKQIALDFAVMDKFDRLPEETLHQGPQAFLTIQEGCDKFCSFCVVPYTRGGEYSRPVADVLAEARRRAAAGVVELTLLGQNVNAYHGAGSDGSEWNLARLLRKMAQIDGIERLRYTTSHPRDMDDALIVTHGEIEEVMPFLHLPVQSGSDRILKRMNRRHTVADYMRIIEKLRKARPDIALSSDFIVGYPGETEEDFEATMQLVRDVHFSQAYSFSYSARPGTPATNEEDQLSHAVKNERLLRLQALLEQQQRDYNAASVGKVYPVLIEKPGRRPGQMMGRTPYMQAVHIDECDAKTGAIVNVYMAELFPHSVRGEIMTTGAIPANQNSDTTTAQKKLA